MPKLHDECDFDVAADQLFDLLADFGNIQNWWPTDAPVAIERVELEGSGVGMVRKIFNVGFTDSVDERLDFIDPKARTYKLSIIGTPPAGMTSYQATGVITETGANKCHIDYDSEFETEPGKENEAIEMLKAVYQLQWQGLKNKLMASR